MDIQGNILSQILNSLDFGFIFIVNLVTYLLIKGIEEIITKKPISKLLKRIVTFSTGIIIGFIVLKISEDTKPVIIFYSFFLHPASFFNISLSSTTTNCQGLLRFEAGAINAAFKISSTCSGESSCSVNLRVLLLFCISVAKLSIFFVLCTLLILRFANINIIFCTHIYVSFFFLVSIFIIEQ